MKWMFQACCFVAGLVLGYCVGVAVMSRRDAWLIEHEREVKRMALDAAAASAVLTEPTAHECAEASRTEGDGYRAVLLEKR